MKLRTVSRMHVCSIMFQLLSGTIQQSLFNKYIFQLDDHITPRRYKPTTLLERFMTRGRPEPVWDKPSAQPAQLTWKPCWYFFCKRGIHSCGAGVLSTQSSGAETEAQPCSRGFLQAAMRRQKERWTDLPYATRKPPDLPAFAGNVSRDAPFRTLLSVLPAKSMSTPLFAKSFGSPSSQRTLTDLSVNS